MTLSRLVCASASKLIVLAPEIRRATRLGYAAVFAYARAFCKIVSLSYLRVSSFAPCAALGARSLAFSKKNLDACYPSIALSVFHCLNSVALSP